MSTPPRHMLHLNQKLKTTCPLRRHLHGRRGIRAVTGPAAGQLGTRGARLSHAASVSPPVTRPLLPPAGLRGSVAGQATGRCSRPRGRAGPLRSPPRLGEGRGLRGAGPGRARGWGRAPRGTGTREHRPFRRVPRTTTPTAPCGPAAGLRRRERRPLGGGACARTDGSAGDG